MSTSIGPRHARARRHPASKLATFASSRTNVLVGAASLTLPAMAATTVTSPAFADPGTAGTPAPASPSSAASTTPATPNTPTTNVVYLRYGSTGSYVRTLQQRLGGGLAVDGIFGVKTLASVKEFQSSKGLDADGIVGPLTWDALGGFPSDTPTTPTPPPTCTVTTVSYGATGSVVKVLQQRLGGLEVDGYFGAATLAAVKQFQTNHNLTANGVVDSGTWTALGGYSCDTTDPAPTGPAPTGTDAKIAKVVDTARQYLGVPYVWGGSSPAGFDCSGLTQYVYAKVGLDIPRTASVQQRFLAKTANPVPGDLVFFGNPAYHVAVYVSPGLEIAAPYPGQVVRVQPIWGTVANYGHFAS